MFRFFKNRIRDGDENEPLNSSTDRLEERRGKMSTEVQPEISNGIKNVSISEEERTGTISLSGKIDQSNSEEILTEIAKLVESSQVDTVIFDMKGVTYVARAGLVMFSTANIKAGEHEKHYKLVHMRPDIVKVFQMMGYSAAFAIEADEESV